MVEFDSLLEAAGSFGRYQLVIIVLLMYYQIPGGLNSIAPVFMSYAPRFRCLVYPFDNATDFPDLTEDEITNITTPTNSQGYPINPCVRYSYNASQCEEKLDLSCVNITTPLITCQQYHYDRAIFSETTVTEFNLVCDRQALDDLAASAYLFGVLVSSFISGYFLDRFGRKIPGLIYSAGMLVAMLLTTYSSTVATFIVSRIFVAFFTFGSHLSVFCLVLEIVGIQWRMIVGVIYHSAYCFGYMLWSIIAYKYRDWHEMQMACLVVSIPLMIILSVVPESPRWLFANGQFGKAVKIVRHIAKTNRRADPFDRQENWRVFEEEKNITALSALDLFRYPGLRISTLKIGFYSMVNNTVYFGIAYNMGSLTGNIFLNNVYGGLLEVCGNIVCLITVKYVGRSVMMSVTIAIAGLLLIGSAVMNQEFAVFSLIFMIVAKGLISGSTSIFCCYIVEFFPTSVRVSGIGFASTMARVGSITSPFLLGLGNYHLIWLPNTVLGMISLVASLVAWTLPDTTGVPMMESMEETELFIEKRSRRWRKL